MQEFPSSLWLCRVLHANILHIKSRLLKKELKDLKEELKRIETRKQELEDLCQENSTFQFFYNVQQQKVKSQSANYKSSNMTAMINAMFPVTDVN